MYQCILWGDGRDYDRYINAVRYQELSGCIHVLGITSKATIYRKIDGYSFIHKSKLTDCDFDLLIIMSISHLEEIQLEAAEMGISEEKILSCEVFSLPNLDLKKYMEIKKRNLTIFSNICWGGIVYSRLKLKFRSPLINLYILDWDYIKLLENPKKYMEQPLVFERWQWNDLQNREIPVCLCGDVRIYFSHYHSFEDANQVWNKRKRRIHWEDIFVMMYTEHRDVAEVFSKLPYENKVCFVPFETKEESLFYIDYQHQNEMESVDLWTIVNGTASGIYKYYNLLDLLYGDRKKGRLE